MISKFSQCIISGRDSMLIALLIIAVLGCIVRGHHMFMVGFDLDIIDIPLKLCDIQYYLRIDH